MFVLSPAAPSAQAIQLIKKKWRVSCGSRSWPLWSTLEEVVKSSSLSDLCFLGQRSKEIEAQSGKILGAGEPEMPGKAHQTCHVDEKALALQEKITSLKKKLHHAKSALSGVKIFIRNCKDPDFVHSDDQNRLPMLKELVEREKLLEGEIQQLTTELKSAEEEAQVK